MLSLKEKGSKKKQILGSVEILRETGGGGGVGSSARRNIFLCAQNI